MIETYQEYKENVYFLLNNFLEFTKGDKPYLLNMPPKLGNLSDLNKYLDFCFNKNNEGENK